MPEPFTMAALLALAFGGAKGAALKMLAMKFGASLGGLKASLATYVGAAAADVSTKALAAGAAAAFYAKHVEKLSDQAAIDAAAAKGVSREVAHAVFDWLRRQGLV